MMEMKSHLTANPTAAESANLLDVNEKLHALSSRLKEKRPEDVLDALKLVNQYGESVGIHDLAKARIEFDRIQQLLPKAKMILVDIGSDTIGEKQLIKDLRDDKVVVEESIEKLVSEGFNKQETVNGRQFIILIREPDLGLAVPSSGNILGKAKELGLEVCSLKDALLLVKQFIGKKRFGLIKLIYEECKFTAFSRDSFNKYILSIGAYEIKDKFKDHFGQDDLNRKIYFAFKLVI